MNGAAVVLAIVGVIFGFAAAIQGVYGRRSVTILLTVLAVLHMAPLIIGLWTMVLFGGRFE